MLATAWAPTFSEVKPIDRNLDEVVTKKFAPQFNFPDFAHPPRHFIVFIFDEFVTLLQALMGSHIALGFEQVLKVGILFMKLVSGYVQALTC